MSAEPSAISAGQPDPLTLLYDLLDTLPAAMLLVSLPDFRIMSVNARACARLGIRLMPDLVGRPCAAVIPRFEEEKIGLRWLASAGELVLDTIDDTVVAASASPERWQAAIRQPSDTTPRRLLVFRLEASAEAGGRAERVFSSSMYQVVQALLATVERDALLNVILEQLRGVVGYESASIMLRGEAGYSLAAARGFADSPDMIGLHIPLEDHLFQAIEVVSDAIILRDAAVEARMHSKFGTFHGWMGVPLRVQNDVLGVLTLASTTPNAYTKSDAARASAFAAYAALAVRNAELHQRTREHNAQLEHALENLRLTQQRLVQTERLLAVGEMVAGVAHELNNPLTAILGFATLLQESGPDEVQQDIAPIVEGAQRARRIVKDLLTFAHQQQRVGDLIDLNVTIRRVVDVYSYLLRTNNIMPQLQLSPDLPAISGDGTALGQLLVNLINNACYAMSDWDDRRVLTISTAREDDANGGWLVLVVADTGPGIAPADLAQIFEPFFTTKPTGAGTGLGLSICYGIAQQFGGHIAVESEPGSGAQITVRLPVSSSG